jgi:inorganic pyrophosphatase
MLGKRMKDKISGFSGIVVGKIEWIYGFCEYALIPETLNNEGEPFDARWFNEKRLIPIDGESKIGFIKEENNVTTP